MGGPMSYYRSNGGTYAQVGVASFYHRDGCDRGKPSGFTRVRDYLTWINSVTGIPVSSSSKRSANDSFLMATIVSLLMVAFLSYPAA